MRLGDSMVRVSQVVNLMPLQRTAIPYLGRELCCCYSTRAGFSEGDRLLVLTEVRAREQQLACVPKALPLPPPS